MHFEKQNGRGVVGDIAGEVAGDAVLEGHTCYWVGCPPEDEPEQRHPEGVQLVCEPSRSETPLRVQIGKGC